MKKYVVLFFLILFLPCIVHAKEYSSDYFEFNDKEYIYSGEEIVISKIKFQREDSRKDGIKNYGRFDFSILNETKESLDISNVSIEYYNQDYELIAKSDKNWDFTLGRLHSTFLYLSEKDFTTENSNFEDIKYFKIKCDAEKIKKEDINEYIYKPSRMPIYKTLDYVIDSYDITVKVNENNSFDITENITAYFNVEKHGIYRTIPLTNKVKRLDGTSSSNEAFVTNVRVSDKYTVEKNDGIYKIKIGDAKKTLTGEQKYTISYNYSIGNDPLDGKDELYLNLIGTDWDTVIGCVTFTIIMPKEFDSSKLGFSYGKLGSTDSEGIYYTVDGNVIRGRFEGILMPHEALTVRCELEEGYFEKEKMTFSSVTIIMILIPLIGLLVSIMLWSKYGRDDKIKETIEFNPPEGLNSLEVAFIYKGRAENSDIISLLLYLADKGYITLTEERTKQFLFTARDFVINKVKDYDGNNLNEKWFLEGLFRKKIDDKMDDKVYALRKHAKA